MSHSSLHRRLGLVALAVSALSACSTVNKAGPAPAPANAPASAPASPAAAAATGLVFAVPQAEGKTAQGGTHEAFAYAEKAGDAKLEKVAVTEGVARITGTIWPQKGSSWAGLGFITSAGAPEKAADLSGYKTLRIQLASATARQLRVRMMGADKATRDSGCYPLVVLTVAPELRELEVPLANFAPESYCGANGRSIALTALAVAAIEVSDASLVAGTQRGVDFQVGRIMIAP